jgi:archaea-specific DNA-binding protein
MDKKQNNKENSISVGQKPFMNYITAVVLQFTSKEAKKVTILARGKFISKAVDIAEITRRKFLENQKVEVTDVRIASEEFENQEGKKVSVSAIEIDLEKKE